MMMMSEVWTDFAQRSDMKEAGPDNSWDMLIKRKRSVKSYSKGSTGEWNGMESCTRICWDLQDKEEENQLRTVLSRHISEWSLLRSKVWSIVLNMALRSSRTRRALCPPLIIASKSFSMWKRAVSVLWLCLYVDWNFTCKLIASRSVDVSATDQQLLSLGSWTSMAENESQCCSVYYKELGIIKVNHKFCSLCYKEVGIIKWTTVLSV